MPGKRRKRRIVSAELDITAFMNLMVVLVPFLLTTAVFTNISILDLKLPSSDSTQNQKNNKQKFDLNVIVRKDLLILTEQTGRTIKRLPITQSGHNYTLLNQTLRLVKNNFPEKTTITILSEEFTPYEDLVHIMDTVREFKALVDGEVVIAELFPDISIGDAPKKKEKDI